MATLIDKVKTDPRHRDARIVIKGPARRRVLGFGNQWNRKRI
ncbi:BLUF domain-containing protein [Thiocystis violacea]|nr:BLUF domain-containing protein [Thiocystis violacea]